MGFDTAWLDLREPADLRARDAGLLREAITHAGPGARLLDLGCGTGATPRAFAAAGAGGLDWRLFDRDAELLAEATRRQPQAEIHQGDLTDLDALPLDGVDMVTASALFDLVSEDWTIRLVDRLAGQGIALYAALNYDGVMFWVPQDRLDQTLRARFNRHQLGDKGFGAALGPEAATRLTAILRGRGYCVSCARSPWRLGPQDIELQAALITGIAAAAQETGLDAAEDWAARRRAMLGEARVYAEIGHLDLLALPGGG